MKALGLRIEDELWERLEELRKSERRSLNAQVIVLLERALDQIDAERARDKKPKRGK